MWERFVREKLHFKFLTSVLAPSVGAAVLWKVGEEWPRPTSWDLLFYLFAALLWLVAFLKAIPWLAKSIAVTVFGQQETIFEEDGESNTTVNDALQTQATAESDIALGDLQRRWRENEKYEHVNTQMYRGEPPVRAFCPEVPDLEFKLEWTGNKVRVSYQGEQLMARSFLGEGQPGKAQMKLVSEADSFEASTLRGMILGVSRLRLGQENDTIFSRRLRNSLSAGHGCFDQWVSLVIDIDTKIVTYNVCSEYDDCR